MTGKEIMPHYSSGICLKYWRNCGFPAEKLIIGFPMGGPAGSALLILGLCPSLWSLHMGGCLLGLL